MGENSKQMGVECKCKCRRCLEVRRASASAASDVWELRHGKAR